MNPKVLQVLPESDFTLCLTFSNGEVRIFDCVPYLDKGVFTALRDTSVFFGAKVVAGSVEWDGEADLSYDTLYVESVPIGNTPDMLVGSTQAVR